MMALLQLLAALVVTIVFMPLAIWAYERERVVTFALTMLFGWASLWVVGLFGVVWLAAVW